MVTREIPILQAMQRHTGCAWVQVSVHPAHAEDKPEKPNTETAAVGRDSGSREKTRDADTTH